MWYRNYATHGKIFFHKDVKYKFLKLVFKYSEATDDVFFLKIVN